MGILDIGEVLRAFSPTRVIEIFREPQLHRQELPLLIGIGLLLLFAILVLFAIIFVRPREEDSEEPGKPGDRKKGLFSLVIWLALFGTLFVAASSVVLVYSGKPTFCRSCHAMGVSYASWQKSMHRSLTCIRCHQKPGVTGTITFKAKLARMVLRQVLSSRLSSKGTRPSGEASKEACMACHDRMIDGTTERYRIRMSHAEPLSGGYECLDCHGDRNIAHGERRPLPVSGMAVCGACHDDRQAPATCAECHVRGGGTARAELADFPKVHLAEPTSCRGCHQNENSCVTCHKVVLPHSVVWVNGGHAQPGMLTRQLCLQCHTTADCQKCHAKLFPHGEDWPGKHGPMYRTPVPGCDRCHTIQEFCLLCHTDVSEFKLKRPPAS